MSSFKTLDYRQTRTKLFNPMPANRLPYYSYSEMPKADAVQLAAGMLFLYNTGRLKINFKETADEYLIWDDSMTKFITANNCPA